MAKVIQTMTDKPKPTVAELEAAFNAIADWIMQGDPADNVNGVPYRWERDGWSHFKTPGSPAGAFSTIRRASFIVYLRPHSAAGIGYVERFDFRVDATPEKLIELAASLASPSSTDSAQCAHMNFRVDAKIGRLSKTEGGPITGYCADVTVKCAECGLPFRFVGLAAGNHHSEPRVSIDGTELRAPIEPATHQRFAASAAYTMPPRATH